MSLAKLFGQSLHGFPDDEQFVKDRSLRLYLLGKGVSASGANSAAREAARYKSANVASSRCIEKLRRFEDGLTTPAVAAAFHGPPRYQVNLSADEV